MVYGHSHGNANLPIILAGGQGLGLRHGQHIDYNLAKITAYLRDRGFPLRVDSIVDEHNLLKVTLLETGLHEISKEWSVGQTHDLSASTTLLRMWEPNGGQSVPDRMVGVSLKSIEELPIGYGCGGASLTFSVPMLYEAYRPGTILKLYPQGHAVPILPIEERNAERVRSFFAALVILALPQNLWGDSAAEVGNRQQNAGFTQETTALNVAAKFPMDFLGSR